LTILREVENSN